jgi:SAM-dependent methyltransferase
MAEFWDGVAAAWERNADAVDEHTAAATQRLLDAAVVGEGAAVLDVAAGPGGAGLAAAERVGPGGRVVLADVAPAMVAVARRRSAGRGNVATTACDQTALDAPDASFDAVICRHGLMFAADPVAAVREAVRVLRPGGRYASMTWGPRDQNPWLGIIMDAVAEQLGAPIPPPGVPGPFSLADRDRLWEVLTEGGLRDVVVETVPAPLAVPSLEEWWRQVPELAGPLAVLLAGLEPEAREAIRARALAEAADVARPEGDGVAFSGLAMISAGQRRA